MTTLSIKDFVNNIKSAEVSGFSALLDAVSRIAAAGDLLAEADRWKLIADAMYNKYDNIAEVATEWAERAARASNTAAQQSAQGAADWARNVANQRNLSGDEAWAKMLAEQNANKFGDAANQLRNLPESLRSAPGMAKFAGPAVDMAQMLAGWYDGLANGEWENLGKASTETLFSTFFGEVGLLLLPAMIPALGLPFALVVAFSFAWGGSKLGEKVWTNFLSSRNWIQRRDPLTLDLDGDGLETVGINQTNPILFDHQGDGLKTATGWIAADDGFLALDRNGNGFIDDGTELFGDSTPLYAGGNAEDGFGALAQEDTNNDGLVDINDANFANLRIWRDLNQNGISEDGELSTLEDSDIAALRTAKTEHSANLANGNQVADLGGFIKSDGTEGGMGAVAGEMGDINLADNPFYSEFTDNPPLTDVALALPGMNGSGQVRDLQSASVLSPDLTATLGGLAGYHTRAELLSQADALIAQWAATSGMETGVQKAHSVGKNLIYLAPGQTVADLQLFLFSSGSGAPVVPSGFGQTPAEAARKAALVQAQADITNLIALLERFNGMTFVNVKSDAEIRTGANALLASYTSGNPSDPWEASWGLATPPYVFVPISTAQWNLLQQSYDALKQSVYDGLVMQTRLKPYLDTISLQVSDSGIQLDYAPLAAELQARFETQPAEAVRDLLDVQRVAGAQLTGSGWDGYQQLRGWLGDIAAMTDPVAKAALTATIIAGLNDFGYGGLRVNGDGTGGSEAVIGDDAGAVLNGAGGNDLVLGGNGDDVLNGGTGNDSLYGGAGNDTYVFNLGDGADTIVETQGEVGNDGLQLGSGVIAGELDIYVDGDKLVFAHANGRDKVSIANWFDSLSDSAHRLDTVRFADGALLNLDALQLGTDGADTLIGTSQSDILMGGAGDDILISDGNDWLNGGTGADSMTGSIGDDMYVVDNAGDVVIELEGEGTDTVYGRVSATLSGNVENLVLVGGGNTSGTGNSLDNTITGNGGSNALYGGDGNDSLIGNAGNDLLDGGSGADVMNGGSGDDSYVVDVVEDTVAELAGQGIDTVYTGLAYTLGANVENLTLTGVDAVDGTGNEQGNVLTGNRNDIELRGKRRLNSRRWRDGDGACANAGWRLMA
jgi:Ca2+-binding RTX toxin-like protein